MSFTWLTDPHLDRAGTEAVTGLHNAIRKAGAQPAIVTGDISNATRIVSDLQQIAGAANGPVYFVLGNHDHYGSSVGKTRDKVIALCQTRPQIQWLPPAGVVQLPDGRVLVGVDGWADGRFGDALQTPLVLNDDQFIEEIAQQPTRVGKLAVKRVLADADARRLGTLLKRAVATGARDIVVATHVPPFVAALAARSREAHIDWHPLLVCGATGRVLKEFATGNPEVIVEVLAGHTHRGSEAQILPNLKVRVGEAKYGQPSLGLVTSS